MKAKRFIALFVFLIALLNYYGLSGQITASEIDQLVNEALEKFNVAGASVGIIKDGKVIHSQGYGVLTIESEKKVDEHTLFGIGSNSKAFTTAALAILVEQGKLSWDDQVKEHIPEFKMYNSYVTENFNIQDLLTHRSGLGLGAGDLMFFPDGSDFTIQDVLNCFQYFEPQSALRTKFDYDNLLYFVAGEVIARTSGMSWEDFVQENILKVLAMNNTTPSLPQKGKRTNLAVPHSTETGSIKVISHFETDPQKINGAAGMIYSSAEDMNKWLLAQLNHGKYGEQLENQLFSNESQREMWKIHTVLDANPNPRYNAHFAGYGLGWSLTDMKGNLVVSHTGGLPGMLSKTIMIPDINLGVVVLTNTSNGGGALFSAVSQTIVDSYLGLDDFEWTDKYLVYLNANQLKADSVTNHIWETVKSANSEHLVIENFTGYFEDKWFGKVEVYLKNNQLWFRSVRSPKLTGPMSYYKANAFAIKWNYQDMNADAFAIFSLDEEGRAEAIRMKGISPNIDFSFDFQDLDLQRVAKE